MNIFTNIGEVTLRYLSLLLINERPYSALQLVGRICAVSLGAFQPELQDMYDILRHLEKNEYLESFEEPDTEKLRGGRPRIMYKITEYGKARAGFAAEMFRSLFMNRAE